MKEIGYFDIILQWFARAIVIGAFTATVLALFKLIQWLWWI
jgi:hypothetical protein